MNCKLTTAFLVRNMVYPSKGGAALANSLLFKGSESIQEIVAVEYNNQIFCTNPVIIVGGKDEH